MRYAITMKSGNIPLLDVTQQIMKKQSLPSWFNWDLYDVKPVKDYEIYLRGVRHYD